MSGDLTEFLVARIDEDEARARLAAKLLPEGEGWYRIIQDSLAADAIPPESYQHIARWDPARVLAECEAKRALIDLAFANAAVIDSEWECCHDRDAIRAGRCQGAGNRAAEEFLALLAVPYAAHQHYRPKWAP